MLGALLLIVAVGSGGADVAFLAKLPGVKLVGDQYTFEGDREPMLLKVIEALEVNGWSIDDIRAEQRPGKEIFAIKGRYELTIVVGAKSFFLERADLGDAGRPAHETELQPTDTAFLGKLPGVKLSGGVYTFTGHRESMLLKLSEALETNGWSVAGIRVVGGGDKGISAAKGEKLLMVVVGPRSFAWFSPLLSRDSK